LLSANIGNYLILLQSSGIEWRHSTNLLDLLLWNTPALYDFIIYDTVNIFIDAFVQELQTRLAFVRSVHLELFLELDLTWLNYVGRKVGFHSRAKDWFREDGSIGWLLLVV
jgi:hypothetical protein